MFKIGQQVVASGIVVSSSDGALPAGIGVVNMVDKDGMVYVNFSGRNILCYPIELKAVNPLRPAG